MAKFKIGDKVKVNAWNYGWLIGSDRLIQQFTQFESSDLQYTVLATDMTMKGRCNSNLDLLVQSPTGKVYAIGNMNVEPWKHTIMIDGKTIKLSEESFQELKRELNA
jgi:hypothetical protein